MKKAVVYGVGGAIAVIGAYFLFKKMKGATNMSPAAQGASGGQTASSPSLQYPFAIQNAPRADTNPYINNQPFAMKAPSGGGSIADVSAISGAVASVADAFSSLFGSSNESDASSDYDVVSSDYEYNYDGYDGGNDMSDIWGESQYA